MIGLAAAVDVVGTGADCPEFGEAAATGPVVGGGETTTAGAGTGLPEVDAAAGASGWAVRVGVGARGASTNVVRD
jgi:hypothetical protein